MSDFVHVVRGEQSFQVVFLSSFIVVWIFSSTSNTLVQCTVERSEVGKEAIRV